MKKLLILLLFIYPLFAKPLQNINSSFSNKEKDELLYISLNSKDNLHSSKTYNIKKGWNQFTTPKDGVNLSKTFRENISYVVTYDKVSKLWAIYRPKHRIKGKVLLLEYLEPNITFFVLATKNIKVKIKSDYIYGVCKEFIDSDNYNYIVDSGVEPKEFIEFKDAMSIKSRYFSHHELGFYRETRVMLIYPKINLDDKILNLTYGPANPKISIKYAKAYQNKIFYVYDYKYKKCFKGVFPSKKIPPFPLLEEL